MTRSIEFILLQCMVQKWGFVRILEMLAAVAEQTNDPATGKAGDYPEFASDLINLAMTIDR